MAQLFFQFVNVKLQYKATPNPRNVNLKSTWTEKLVPQSVEQEFRAPRHSKSELKRVLRHATCCAKLGLQGGRGGCDQRAARGPVTEGHFAVTGVRQGVRSHVTGSEQWSGQKVTGRPSGVRSNPFFSSFVRSLSGICLSNDDAAYTRRCISVRNC